MGRYGSGGTVLTIRSRMVFLLCGLLASSFLSSSSAYGLSVDPLVDSALTVTKLNEAEDSISNDRRRGTEKSGDDVRIASPNIVTRNNTVTPRPESALRSAVVTEPIGELPPMEAFDAQQAAVRLPKYSSSVAVLIDAAPGGSVTPSLLQASNHGWKLFEVAWYWWAIGFAAGYYGIRRISYLWRHQRLEDVAAPADA